MASISGVIPNVIGGISQQPPAARLENTASDIKNAIPSVVSGLRKRPPLQYIASLMASPANSVAYYMLDRPDADPKFVIVADQTVRVFDHEGNEEPVTMEAGSASYIPTNARHNIGFMSIADSVYIYNKDKKVEVSPITETRTDPEDQITMYVENTAGGAKFRLRLDDSLGNSQVGEFTTDDSTPEDTTEIAIQVRQNFDADGTLSLTANRKNHIIFVRNVGGVVENYEADPGSLTTIYRGFIDEFTKLPPSEIDGRIVQVDPSADSSSEDSYWVSFNKSKGIWEECVGYDQQEELDASTMPHLLTDNGDGTWTFGPQEWAKREVGDEDSNPTPSFVGYKIRHMFTAANRMVILADQYMVASEVDTYENFYRTTCTVLLDSDRIDVAALNTDSRVSYLYSAVDFDNALLLFSDRTQFRLDISNGLTPSTVSLMATTGFNSSKLVKPIRAGTNVLFVDDQNNSSWVDVREYMVDNVIGINTSEIITKQVPELLPSGVYSMVPNDTLGLVLIHSEADLSKVFLYSYYFADNQRVQSSWSYWEDTNVNFLGGYFDGTLLYMLIERDGQLVLTKMSMQETVSGDVEGLEIMLDYRVHSDDVTVTPGVNQTTLELPYNTLSDEKYVLVLTEDGTDTAGTAYELEVTSVGSNQLVLDGVVLNGDAFYIGKTYEFVYEMSPIFIRDDNKVPVQDGRLQLRYISLMYHQSSYFEVDVEIPGRRLWKKVFTGRVMGAYSNVIGDVAVSDGEFRVPVSSEASKVVITVRNDSPFNCRFSSIEWEGVWRAKTKMMR